jgi:hypothetical protein
MNNEYKEIVWFDTAYRHCHLWLHGQWGEYSCGCEGQGITCMGDGAR